jgi:hypothetical protein
MHTTYNQLSLNVMAGLPLAVAFFGADFAAAAGLGHLRILRLGACIL